MTVPADAPRRSGARSVAVFCGFSAGNPAAGYRAAAAELGVMLARGGHRLVYGGGNGGLMGVVAGAALAAGGTALGVVPRGLRERDLAAHSPAHPVIVTADLFERKRVLIAEADGVIALPGGLGTLDEILDVVALRALGEITIPLALVDVDGAWGPLLSLVADLRRRGFVRREAGFTVVASPAAALAHVLTPRTDVGTETLS